MNAELMDSNVLVVEDDPELAALIARLLEDMGGCVRIASTGGQALRLIREGAAELVLLDLGLPDVDGMSVCREVTRKEAARVIIITARDDAEAAATAIDLGAEDYIRKPFNLDELRARVRAALRRGKPGDGDVLRVGPLAIDRNRCVVVDGDRTIQLSATELRLLCYLADHPGWVFSKEHLLEALWPDDRDAHAVQVHISNLRHKLEPDPAQPKYLVTVKGLGYKLRA